MRPINDPQQKIYEFLCERSQCGVPPSVREIGSAVGLRSTSSVQANLDALEEAGYIERDPMLKRSIRIVGQAENVRHVPLLGTVTAGMPILAVEAPDDEVVTNSKARVIDLVLPIVVLIVICVFSLFYVGRCMGEEWVFASANYDASLGFIDAFSNTDATVGLPWGGLVALVLIIIYMAIRQTVSFKESMECIPQGFIAMVPAILILTFLFFLNLYK